MIDHYKTLGVSRTAKVEEIKGAFKKLALRYHPDKNPGNVAAEEYFKQVNSAYQVLSDPYKKSQYDLLINYSGPTPQGYSSRPPVRKKRRDAPQYSRPNNPYKYVIGWTYLKHQLLAFAFIAIVGLMVFLGVEANKFRLKKNEEALIAGREMILDSARAQFTLGDYRSSLEIVTSYLVQNPIEQVARNYRTDVVSGVRKIAETQFSSEKYQAALINFNIVKDFKLVQDLDVYHKMASCYKAIGNYEKAAAALDYVWLRDRENIELNLELGQIHRDILESPEDAIKYYNRAREKVKSILSTIYGNAFEVVMNPKTSPEIYYEVFYQRAITNNELGDYNESIKDCNWAVFFRPERSVGYLIRGNNYFSINNQRRACQNWTQSSRIGNTEAQSKLNQNCR